MAKHHKILVVSHFGGVGEMAQRFLMEGHEVKFCITDPPSRDINDGLIKKVKHWEPWVEWSDLVVFDDTRFSKQAEACAPRARRWSVPPNTGTNWNWTAASARPNSRRPA